MIGYYFMVRQKYLLQIKIYIFSEVENTELSISPSHSSHTNLTNNALSMYKKQLDNGILKILKYFNVILRRMKVFTQKDLRNLVMSMRNRVNTLIEDDCYVIDY